MLPQETLRAIFPIGMEVRSARWPHRAVFKTQPVTIAHAAAMEAFGCDLGARELSDAHALIAAFIATLSPDEAYNAVFDRDRTGRRLTRWMRRRTKFVSRIAREINAHLALAFLNFVPPKREGRQIIEDAPSGFGWPLEIVEALCAEFGWQFEDALRTPLSRALSLVSVARKRNGGENGGPDYYERQLVLKLKETIWRDNGRKE